MDLNSKITTSIAQAEENERENDDFFNTIVDEQPVKLSILEREKRLFSYKCEKPFKFSCVVRLLGRLMP